MIWNLLFLFFALTPSILCRILLIKTWVCWLFASIIVSCSLKWVHYSTINKKLLLFFCFCGCASVDGLCWNLKLQKNVKAGSFALWSCLTVWRVCMFLCLYWERKRNKHTIPRKQTLNSQPRSQSWTIDPRFHCISWFQRTVFTKL